MTATTMNEPGYEKLSDVLSRAYDQAAIGKGKDRHANGEPFHEQVMQTGAQRFGTGALLFQAFKKSEESQRLPHDRAIAELLGAIVYLAGAVIALERDKAPESLEWTKLAKFGPTVGWNGGTCPVAEKRIVIVQLFGANGIVRSWSYRTYAAGTLNWAQTGGGAEGEISAYRTVD